MNRRNVLIGVGAIVGGGGAALGTGALDQTSADRGLEVEVIVDDDIAVELVDVQIDTSPDTVEIGDEESGDLNADSLFPGQSSDVSLIQNDVTVFFGPFLGGADTTYNAFFSLINDENEAEADGDFEVSFDFEPDSVFSVSDNNVVVTETSTETVDLTITADDDTTGTLTIELTRQN